jgi:hypothetical protein
MNRRWIGKLRGVILRRIRMLMICTALLAGGLVCGSQLVDEGEVVGLTTGDDEQETDLWIVDLEDASYLRAGAPNVSWLARLRVQPAVTLERADSVRPFRAVPVDAPATLGQVNRAMAEKYGLADTLWGHVGDRSRAVAVRLEPLDAFEELAGDDRNAN